MKDTVRWIDEMEVSRLTGRAPQTLRNDRAKGQGLPYTKFGRLVRYSVQDVHEFMDSHRVDTRGL
jgi:hypothetical protein